MSTLGYDTSSPSSPSNLIHGFEKGEIMEVHSLQAGWLNGAQGQVLEERGERIGVSFPPPIGAKSLKPENLRVMVLAART
mmetsp:Transcript_114829/g.180811  ORF Transcript_114829/g.180811 Transcript_114829/m.180811 type:complete len:80 (-) Transcript_114829:291-530(-)